ncbi:MAG: trigger factor [Lentisphaeria bacterium]|nr:trigger factor [Lentisphaeria bacterium]
MNNDNFTISTDKSTPCQLKFTVTVPQTEIKSALDQAMKQFKRHAQIPGFRKGKAPLAMIMKAHAEQIKAEVQETLTKIGYEKATTENSDSKIAGYPTLSQETIDLDAAEYTFSMTVEVEPEFELGDYKAIRVETEEVVVTDEEVAAAIEEIRGSQKKIEKAEAGTPAKKGDMLKVSYEAAIDGELDESAQRLVKAESSWLILDEPEMLPGIKTILDGATSNEAVVADVTFPGDFHNETLAGNTYSYTFNIEEVHTGVLPELNDEFAQALQLKDLAELNEKLQERITAQKQEAVDSVTQEKALAAMRGLAGDFAVSASQIKSETEEARKNESNKDKSEAELAQIAKERVQNFYLLMKLTQAEEIQVTEKELLGRIEMMAQYSQKDAKVMQKQLVKEGKIQGLAMDITLNKTAQRITDIAAGRTAE